MRKEDIRGGGRGGLLVPCASVSEVGVDANAGLARFLDVREVGVERREAP
jgi:hypothetical protein